MRKAKFTFLLAAVVYMLLIFPFTAYLKSRPLQLKVGYVPEAKVLKFITADHRYAVAEWTVLKVLFYFGALIQHATSQNLFALPPDYPGMFKILQTALKIQPYNADAYYFAQGAYTWEVGRYREVNNMLEYGMKYRTWDYQLPFFAGFNSAYFLKDYKKAAVQMKKAAEIAKEQHFATLAARYFYEAGETDFAILFIDVMKKSAKNPSEKKMYDFRRKALVAIKTIETAMNRYQARFDRPAQSLQQLVAAGFLTVVPRDPYGGKFYLDEQGKVRTTSKLSIAGAKAAAENR